MLNKINKLTLPFENSQTNAFIFLPENTLNYKSIGIFTHGYTSHKDSILNWAIRLCDSGMPCIIFDLPGHYLGSYNEVEDFDYFKNNAHTLFETAFHELDKALNKINPDTNIVLGGHSLGALLSLKAMPLKCFTNYNKVNLSVGLGLPEDNSDHIFNSNFYKDTLRTREQLMSPGLSSSNVLPWIKNEKKNLDLHNTRIHLITGKDDIVATKEGPERIAHILEANNNTLTIDRPQKLPHHMPEMAAGHIKKFLRDNNYLD